MNFWATIEHSLQYKYKRNMPERLSERLHKAADAIVVLDEEMASVRDEILDAQNAFNIKANMVADILINIQNLYGVAKLYFHLSQQCSFQNVKALCQHKILTKYLDF